MSEQALEVPKARALATRRGHVVRATVLWCIAGAFTVGMYLEAPALAAGYLVFIAIVIARNVIKFRHQARHFIADNAEAIAALTRGDLAKAHDILWAWAERARAPRVSSLARHNLAWTLMRQGKLAHAIAILEDNDRRNRGSLRAVGLFPATATQLAFAHGLLGDLEAAATWLREAEVRGKSASAATRRNVTVLARTAIACRSGRGTEAAGALDDHWPEYEGMLNGESLRPLRVLRAFAIASGGPRESGRAETAAAAARPHYPDEFRFLATAWPEMAAFLASSGLASSTN